MSHEQALKAQSMSRKRSCFGMLCCNLYHARQEARENLLRTLKISCIAKAPTSLKELLEMPKCICIHCAYPAACQGKPFPCIKSYSRNGRYIRDAEYWKKCGRSGKLG